MQFECALSTASCETTTSTEQRHERQVAMCLYAATATATVMATATATATVTATATATATTTTDNIRETAPDSLGCTAWTDSEIESVAPTQPKRASNASSRAHTNTKAHPSPKPNGETNRTQLCQQQQHPFSSSSSSTCCLQPHSGSIREQATHKR